ncbi:hypothetical protein TNCV_1060351 [Trichonephila clavipes]|nr:hypothetical protein TNCV_1060351 [Trichonephila clavipes]
MNGDEVILSQMTADFSLSSDSHRILIWREREAAIIPRTSLKRDRYGDRGVLVWEASCLVVVQTSSHLRRRFS